MLLLNQGYEPPWELGQRKGNISLTSFMLSQLGNYSMGGHGVQVKGYLVDK